MRGYKDIDNMSIDECRAILQTDISQDIRNRIENRISELMELERQNEKNAFDNCQTVVEYKHFVEKYPNSKLKSKAEEIIDNLSFGQLKKSASGCKSYILEFPNGKHVAEANEIIRKKKHKSVIITALILLIAVGSVIVLANSIERESEEEEIIEVEFNVEDAIEEAPMEDAVVEDASAEDAVVDECEEVVVEDEYDTKFFVVDFNEIVRVGPGTEYDAKYSEYNDIKNNYTNSAVVFKGTKVEFLGREENNYVYVRQCQPNNDRDDWNEGWISKAHIHEL